MDYAANYQGGPEYLAALKAHDKALAAYQAACQAYRAQSIGDAEFMAACALRKAADKAFDAAFAIAAGWVEA